MFSVLGFMAEEQGVDISKVAESGKDTASPQCSQLKPTVINQVLTARAKSGVTQSPHFVSTHNTLQQ